jgi:hypothetical protein
MRTRKTYDIYRDPAETIVKAIIAGAEPRDSVQELRITLELDRIKCPLRVFFRLGGWSPKGFADLYAPRFWSPDPNPVGAGDSMSKFTVYVQGYYATRRRRLTNPWEIRAFVQAASDFILKSGSQ